MSDSAAKRPIAVWLYCAALVLWIAWSLTQSLPVVQRGYLSPFQLLIGYGPYIAGTIGFWLMRWWGVLALFFAAVIGVILAAALPLWVTLGLAAVTFLPALVIAYSHRTKFKV